MSLQANHPFDLGLENITLNWLRSTPFGKMFISFVWSNHGDILNHGTKFLMQDAKLLVDGLIDYYYHLYLAQFSLLGFAYYLFSYITESDDESWNISSYAPAITAIMESRKDDVMVFYKHS